MPAAVMRVNDGSGCEREMAELLGGRVIRCGQGGEEKGQVRLPQ